jgi:hypothetical protein
VPLCLCRFVPFHPQLYLNTRKLQPFIQNLFLNAPLFSIIYNLTSIICSSKALQVFAEHKTEYPALNRSRAAAPQLRTKNLKLRTKKPSFFYNLQSVVQRLASPSGRQRNIRSFAEVYFEKRPGMQRPGDKVATSRLRVLRELRGEKSL